MKLETFAVMLLILLAAFYGGWYLYDNIGEDFFSADQPVVQTPAEETTPPAKAVEPRLPMPPRHPVSLPNKLSETETEQASEPSFPLTLGEGDAYLKERLPQLLKNRDLRSLLILKYFIQKLVVIIDHLPEASIPRQHLPLRPPESGFLTTGTVDQLVIDERNANRYAPYVKLLESIPDAALLRLYQGLYPLFQQAYRENGKPKGHFNDRLIQVIDHLMKTPEPEQPLPVTLHISRFKYTDEFLESRSAGQKTLLRMGVPNTRRIKQKLMTLRQGLVGEG